MTCIVGIESSDGVWIGGDSCAGDANWRSSVTAEPKVFVRGSFLIGYTSSFRMGQLLKHSLPEPEHPEGLSDEGFMATKFINAVRKTLKDGGFAKKESEVEAGGTFLVGYKGKLYTVYSDYQVLRLRSGYTACGCGEDFATGSLYMTDNIGAYFGVKSVSAERRIALALETAEENSAGVRGPFTVLFQEAA